ncbi:MAG: hypothetical protein GXY98_06755 [Erysipelothrix sp.]|nr:hypothetical protein [Erysipelothrix sp.]
MIIENEYLFLEVKTKGAEMTHLIVKNPEREFLFQPTETSWNRQAPHLFPIVGKLINNEYIYKQKTYPMGQHGFLRDQELTLVEKSDTHLRFIFVSNQETRKIYPFDFKFWVEYQLLKKGLKITYTIENFGDESMFFSVGSHPGFLLNLNIESTITLIPKKKRKIYQYFNEKGLISDAQPLENTSFVVNQSSPLNDTFIYDNVEKIVLENDEIVIEMNCNQMDYLALWSALDVKTEKLSNMICIEPWLGMPDCTFSNQQLNEKKAITELKPQKTISVGYKLFPSNANEKDN